MADKRISDLTPATPPYDIETLVELAIPDGVGGWLSRHGRLGDLRSESPLVSDIVVAAAVSVALAGTDYNITSIPLGIGDWNITGAVAVNPASGTTLTNFQGWTSLVSATRPTIPNKGAMFSVFNPAAAPSSTNQCFPVGLQRVSLAAPGTIYLSTRCSFSGGSVGAYGFLRAERVRG